MHVNEANRPDRHSKIDDEALIVDLRKILDHTQVVLKRNEQDSQTKGAEGHAETTSSAEEMGGEGTSSTSKKPVDKERELISVVERALQGLTRQADTAVSELAGAEPGGTTEATAKEAEKDELATFKASEVELVINSLNDPREWSGMAERDVMIDSVLYGNNPTGILFRFRCDLALATSNRDAAEVERLTKELDSLFALWAAPLAEIAEYPLERLCALARAAGIRMEGSTGLSSIRETLAGAKPLSSCSPKRAPSGAVARRGKATSERKGRCFLQAPSSTWTTCGASCSRGSLWWTGCPSATRSRR